VFSILAIALASTAGASPETFGFFGTSGNSPSPFDSNQLSGSVTYDTSSFTADILTGSVSVGSATWTYASKPAPISNLNSIYVYNDVGTPQFDAMTFYIGITGSDVLFGSTTYRPSFLVLSFGSEQNVFSSSAIPSDPNVLNGFSERFANIQFEILDGQGFGTGQFTGLAFAPITVGNPVSPVPEPETYGMLLTGLGLLGFLARRRKKKAV
jgi:hypothetical protein